MNKNIKQNKASVLQNEDFFCGFFVVGYGRAPSKAPSYESFLKCVGNITLPMGAPPDIVDILLFPIEGSWLLSV